MADDAKRPLKRQKIGPEQIDILPPELRNMIWHEVLLAEKDPTQEEALPVMVWRLDSNDERVCTVEEASMGNAFCSDMTTDNPAPLERSALIEARTPHFAEFLSEISPQVNFVFTNTDAMQDFVALINPHLKNNRKAADKHDITLRLTLRLFDDSDEFKTMAGWEAVPMAHGYAEDARSHVQEWVDVVQTIAGACHVFLEFRQHWRDYRALRGVTRGLREKKGWKVDVLAKDNAWKGVPEHEFHQCLTVASVKGLELDSQRDMGDAKAQDLVRYGCRGLRGFQQYVS